jgi:hypothetical protein
LHSCSPPIIHGNLTCDTIFIQHNGLVKIGSGNVNLNTVFFSVCSCKVSYSMGLQGECIHHGGFLFLNLQWFTRVSWLSNSLSGTQKHRTKRGRVGFAACHRWHRSAYGKGREFFSNVGRLSCPQNPSGVFVCGIGQQMSGGWGDQETPTTMKAQPNTHSNFVSLTLSFHSGTWCYPSPCQNVPRQHEEHAFHCPRIWR